MVESIVLSPIYQKIEQKAVQLEADGDNKGFGEFLKESLNKVNSDLLTSENLTRDFALGKDVELHQVVLASEQASLALQLTIQIRTKIVEAYQEIMRMQL
ncbi:MAG: flagellar hook-basal body complex protein FliE [Firmicutes bacterium HGW-Firmicutes-12]|jgi:flagellar hook-basal body complex protein FliE|nr:MAG: flagellar hook-basal body complex protein FliE [Firmicutes bacterium HGW-Firmicutes-12]